jgi:O-antigen ligase
MAIEAKIGKLVVKQREAALWRTRLGKWLGGSSRLAFGLTYVLFFSTPSWIHGTFSLFPLVTLSLADKVYSIGIAVLLPVLALVTGIAGWASSTTRHVLHFWQMTLAVASLGLLVLIRAWPAQALLASVTASLAIGLFWLAYVHTVANPHEHDIVAAFTILLLCQGIVGTSQFLLQHSVGLGLLGELALRPEAKLVSVVEIGETRWLRAYGLTGHPNLLGGYLVMWLLVCLGQARKEQSMQTSLPRVVLWLALAAGMMGVFCSFSRSAWLGLALGLVYFGVLERRRVAAMRRRLGADGLAWDGLSGPGLGQDRPRDWRVMAAALVLCGVMVGVLFAYRELVITRFFRLDTPLESRSIRDRVGEVAQAWGLVRERPLVGVGSGYYLGALWDRAGDNPPPGFRMIHNIPLLAWAELGILGPVLWLWMLLTPPVVLWRASRMRMVEPNEAGWAAAFVAATVFSLFDSYLYLPMTLWPTLGVGVLAGGWARSFAKGERRV